MTWRALILGLVLVAGMCWVDVIAGLGRGYTWTTEGHFPEAAVFLLVFVTLVVNVLIKLFRRKAGLRQAELMLIWCMLIVGATIPTTGLMRFWCPMLAGPAYFSGRSEVAWRETSLAAAPDELLLTKNAKSFAAQTFYEGQRAESRVPWGLWLPPMLRWLVFIVFFHLAVIFMCAILRKQWVDNEHLLFPLARVPLDFTEGSGGRGLLPTIFGNRAFLIGFVGATVFRLLRAVPVFCGGEQAWNVMIPLGEVLQETPLRYTYMASFPLWWVPIGFAYLVPADVSLSVWFFYLFGRLELQTAAWLGSPLHYGGTWSPLMRWQQAGSYIAFTIGAIYMTRRHLVDVVKKALGRPSTVDDSQESVSYRVAFWGLAISLLISLLWFWHYGMRLWTAAALLLIMMCAQFVHARIVSQSGLYWTWLMWSPPDLLHNITLGRAFCPAGITVAQMQRGIMMHNLYLAPAAMQSLRIGEVFRKRRRLLVPALLITLAVAIVVSSWTYLTDAHARGVLNFSTGWGGITNPQNLFNAAHQQIERPYQILEAEWVPLGLGAVLTAFVMFMRARFYWWPIHSIGLLAISNWPADRMWLPFLLGWLTKIVLMKFTSGRTMRQARFFFIGLIMADASLTFVSAIVGLVSGGATADF